MAAMPEYELVAGADLNPAMRAGFLAAYPGTKAYETVAAMCAADDVDAVWVATPNRFHCEHAIEAMRHGKHVIVEKPMAIDLDEADRMVEAARTHGVKLACGHTRSLSIWNRAMRRIALGGSLGAVTAIHIWAYTDWLIRPRTADELDPATGRRHRVPPGAASDRHDPALGRRARAQRARANGALARRASGAGLLHRVPRVRRRHAGDDHAQRLRLLRDVANSIRGWPPKSASPTPIARACAASSSAAHADEDSEKEEWRIGGRRDPTKKAPRRTRGLEAVRSRTGRGELRARRDAQRRERDSSSTATAAARNSICAICSARKPIRRAASRSRFSRSSTRASSTAGRSITTARGDARRSRSCSR